jgi:hypothetical protein
MNHDRAMSIQHRIEKAETHLRDHTVLRVMEIRRPCRTIPADILAPVAVFAEDHMRWKLAPGAWLSLTTIHKGFLRWLHAIQRGDLATEYSMVRFGRCLGQILRQPSERKRIKRHQVRGFNVLAVWEDGDEFFDGVSFE